MQDDALFNGSDPKQRGHGCDELCPKDKRLKFKWRWIEEGRLTWFTGDPRNESKKRRPGQVSEAILQDDWVLQAVFWHTEYEAEVRRDNETVYSYHVSPGEETHGNTPLFSRIDAQIKAEELFEEMAKGILRQCEAGKDGG